MALFRKKSENRVIDYVSDPIGSLYRRLLPSAIGSLLTSTVASMIDVAILSYYLGTDMLAVVGFCMPVYMLVNTLGMLIASGAATLYSQYLGEGNKTEAMRFYSASVTHTVSPSLTRVTLPTINAPTALVEIAAESDAAESRRTPLRGA